MKKPKKIRGRKNDAITIQATNIIQQLRKFDVIDKEKRIIDT